MDLSDVAGGRGGDDGGGGGPRTVDDPQSVMTRAVGGDLMKHPAGVSLNEAVRDIPGRAISIRETVKRVAIKGRDGKWRAIETPPAGCVPTPVPLPRDAPDAPSPVSASHPRPTGADAPGRTASRSASRPIEPDAPSPELLQGASRSESRDAPEAPSPHNPLRPMVEVAPGVMECDLRPGDSVAQWANPTGRRPRPVVATLGGDDGGGLPVPSSDPDKPSCPTCEKRPPSSPVTWCPMCGRRRTTGDPPATAPPSGCGMAGRMGAGADQLHQPGPAAGADGAGMESEAQLTPPRHDRGVSAGRPRMVRLMGRPLMPERRVRLHSGDVGHTLPYCGRASYPGRVGWSGRSEDYADPC